MKNVFQRHTYVTIYSCDVIVTKLCSFLSNVFNLYFGSLGFITLFVIDALSSFTAGLSI